MHLCNLHKNTSVVNVIEQFINSETTTDAGTLEGNLSVWENTMFLILTRTDCTYSVIQMIPQIAKQVLGKKALRNSKQAFVLECDDTSAICRLFIEAPFIKHVA